MIITLYGDVDGTFWTSSPQKAAIRNFQGNIWANAPIKMLARYSKINCSIAKLKTAR